MLTLEELALPAPQGKTYERVPFGKEMRKQFQFDGGWTNMNHGSFGSTPAAITNVADQFRRQSETRPDAFILYAYPQLLDKSRAAVAQLLNAPIDTCVFVANATTGVNTVLRNIPWNDDGLDEILYISTIYGACGKTVVYVEETTQKVKRREIRITYPIPHSGYVKAFEEAIAASKAAGKRPRLAIFDTVSSVPGVRVPYERLVSACAANGILSLIDGAHGIGHIPLDLSALQPDFFISNCHKWLFVPRGCAVFHVPLKNQHYIRSTLPTSHGFVPLSDDSGKENPLPASGTKSAWEENFEFVGTVDYTPYVCVGEAIRWRKEVCGGEEAIFEYCNNLLRSGSKIVADILGAEVLKNGEGEGDLLDCQLAMIPLPINVGAEDAAEVVKWLKEIVIKEFKTSIFIAYWQGQFWTRMSAQVYLEDANFRWAGEVLKTVSERANKGEWKLDVSGLQIHDVLEAEGKALE